MTNCVVALVVTGVVLLLFYSSRFTMAGLGRVDNTLYGLRMTLGTGSSPDAQTAAPFVRHPNPTTSGFIDPDVHDFEIRDRHDLGQFSNRPLAIEARLRERRRSRRANPSFMQLLMGEANFNIRKTMLSEFFTEAEVAIHEANDTMEFQYRPRMLGTQYAYRIGFMVRLRGTHQDDPERGQHMSFWTPWTGRRHIALAAARMITVAPGTGNVSVRLIRSAFVPVAQADLLTSPVNLAFAGSAFGITNIDWVTLIIYDLRRLLMGNGVMVNQLRRAFFSPLHLSEAPGGIPVDLFESRDCLFNSLALAAKLQVPACQRNPVQFLTVLMDRMSIINAGQRIKMRVYEEAIKNQVRNFDMRHNRPGDRVDIKVFVEHCFPRWSVLVVNRDCEPLERFVSRQSRRDGDCTGKELVLMLSDSHYTCLLPYMYFDGAPLPSLSATSSADRRLQVERARAFVRAVKISQRVALKRPGMTTRVTEEGMQRAIANYTESTPKYVWPRKVHTEMSAKVGYVDLETEQRPYLGDGETSLRDTPFDPAAPTLTNFDVSPREQLPIICVWTMLTENTPYQGNMPQLDPAVVKYSVGYECVHEFFTFLHNYNEEDLNGFVFYAHNGGRFDYVLLLRALLQPPTSGRFVIATLMPRGGGFLAMKINRCRDNASIWFLDTFYHLSTSLDRLCADFNPPHRKQTGAVDYEQLTLSNLRNDPEFSARWIDYAVHDILSLAEIWEVYRRTIFNKYRVDLTRRVFTAATLSKTVFLSTFYHPNRGGGSGMPVYSLGYECEETVRRGYSGGRCEVFCHRYEADPNDPTDGVYYVDFTSLYPYEMCKDLPYGKPERVRTCISEIVDGKFFGFVVVSVRSTRTPSDDARNGTDVPYLCVTANDADNGSGSKLVFGVFPEFTELVLFSEEIVYILEENLPYEFEHVVNLDGFKFCRGPLLEEFSRELFNRKRNADNATERRVAKITVNSGYGFWAMRRIRDAFHVVSIDDGEQAEKLSQNITDGYYSHVFVCNGAFVGRTADFADSNAIVPSIGAAITAYARTTLHRLMHKIKKHGGKILYCDTDSVITNFNVENHPAFEGMMGKELGQLTNELDKWPNGRATSFVALGPKMYGLKSSEGNLEKTAHKGFKSVGYDDMLRMWEQREASPPIEETQMQFRFQRSSLYTSCATFSTDDVSLEPCNMPVSLQRIDARRSVEWPSLQNQSKRRRVDPEDRNCGETEPPCVYAAPAGSRVPYEYRFS